MHRPTYKQTYIQIPPKLLTRRFAGGRSAIAERPRCRVRYSFGQTDGQTDSFLIARPRLHCIQRGKNVLFSTFSPAVEKYQAQKSLAH